MERTQLIGIDLADGSATGAPSYPTAEAIERVLSTYRDKRLTADEAAQLLPTHQNEEYLGVGELMQLESCGVPAWKILEEYYGESHEAVRSRAEKRQLKRAAINALIEGMNP